MEIDHSLIEQGNVHRYHSDPSAFNQTTGQHSWGVARLLFDHHPKPSMALIRAAIDHDRPEIETSDVSAKSKWAWPPELAAMFDEVEQKVAERIGATVSLLPDEHLWLKWADMTEAMLWCRFLWLEHGVNKYRRIFYRLDDRIRNRHGVPKSALLKERIIGYHQTDSRVSSLNKTF